MDGEEQVSKLERHLTLLKEEYVKLQNRMIELEQKYSVAVASLGQTDENSFVAKLLKTVADLFDKDLYSDITVSFGGQTVKAHKFVLAARSDHWCIDRYLNEIDEIQLNGVSEKVGLTLMKWVYTDKATIPNDESFLIELVKAANTYHLKDLKVRCERMLMSSVTVLNCIKFYQTAEDIGAKELQLYCTEIISCHWHDLKTEDFRNISAPLLYEMFKSKSTHPLHLAIKHLREDILFLFLIEFNSQLPEKLNEFDSSTGQLPLEIALTQHQESIAKTLVSHGCDINKVDEHGYCLLHKCIKNGDEFAAKFLIKHGANTNLPNKSENATALHFAASYKWTPLIGNVNKMTSIEGMARILELLLDNGADPNAQDSKGRTPLHRAIDSRNAMVFDALLERSSLNLELQDDRGFTPLWLSLTDNECFDPDDEDSFGAKLVSHGASTDTLHETTGNSLLHLAASTYQEKAGLFLASHGALSNHFNNEGETPLHVAAKNGMVTLITGLLNNGANPNAQTTHTKKMEEKEKERSHTRDLEKLVAREKAINIIKQKQIDVQAKEQEKLKHPHQLDSSQQNSNNSVTVSNPKTNPFEEDLGISLNPFEEDLGLTSNPFDQESRQCIVCDDSNPFMEDIRAETVTSFEHNEKETRKGEYAIEATHLEEEFHNPTEEEINKVMMDQNLYKDPFDKAIIIDCSGKTPLHEAVIYKHEDVLDCFINFQDNNCRGGRLHLLPDYNIIDSEEQTSLELALWTKQYKVASRLLEAGANINLRSPSGLTLIQKAIMKEDVETSIFLLNHGVDTNLRTTNNTSVLQLAIQYYLQPVVNAICSKNVDLDACDDNGNCPLWSALLSGQDSIATTLISHGCSPDAWNIGPNGCTQSLLHRAICDKHAEMACFLIRNNCDINSPRRPGPGGDGGMEAWDGLSPLHLACVAGLDTVVQCLVEHKCNVNIKDSEGRAPIHIAICSKHPIITCLLLAHPDIDMALKDRRGNSPFALAMSVKNHEAASAILAREPDAAEQFDSKGLNFLHAAVLKIDVETLLFLVGVGVNVNSRVQDSSHQTALHLAVISGREMIVRHLLLAGAQVNDCDKHGQTSLHMAAMKNHSSIISALLREGIDHDAVDEKGNNALHMSVQFGHIECVRVLLTESSINAELQNTRGQNPLHILCQYSNENAVSILELFCQTMPEYPINALDLDGNTPLFLAYINGAARLCREILRHGGLLATVNKYGISIFNAEVPTKKLLFSLLDMLDAEPPWSDGSNCHECSVKFSVKTRKHHCRHCGRLLCSKCSDKQIPVVKYELSKPVRVCNVCFEMLTSGIR